MPSATPWPTPEPLPTRAALPPSSTWTTYTEHAYGFSFTYPANWYRDGTKVLNWTPTTMLKRSGTPPEEIAIEFTVLPELGGEGGYVSLDDWVARRPLFHPDMQHHDMREARVDGRRALRWEVQGGLVPEGVFVVAVGERERIYLVTGYPAHTIYRPIFERVVQSLRLPRLLPATGGP